MLRSENCSETFALNISQIMRPLITVPPKGRLYENPNAEDVEKARKVSYIEYFFHQDTW